MDELKLNDDDIAEFLKKIAQNENENFKLFREKVVEYCTNTENGVFTILRLLGGIENELHHCLNGRTKVSVDRAIIIKVLKTIRIELEIVRCRMRNPAFENEIGLKPAIAAPKPAGKWTGNKLDLIELIKAIQISVDHGKVSLSALQKAFEYIFQVKLGNISDRFTEISERSREKPLYLEILINRINQLISDSNK